MQTLRLRVHDEARRADLQHEETRGVRGGGDVGHLQAVAQDVQLGRACAGPGEDFLETVAGRLREDGGESVPRWGDEEHLGHSGVVNAAAEGELIHKADARVALERGGSPDADGLAGALVAAGNRPGIRAGIPIQLEPRRELRRIVEYGLVKNRPLFAAQSHERPPRARLARCLT
ncbi:MAG: hypothetical protein NTW87_22675 [Planctomycetota bacterium]|nr:hypothetical protein [Planctomycetota bacterium]